MHSALDIVEERHREPSQAGAGGSKSQQVTMYLGYLCPIEEFHLYGYVSNTHIKVRGATAL